MEHPGEKHIDPRLLALIKKSEKEGGIFLKEVPKDALIEISTNNSVYTIAVVDIEKCRIAVKGNNNFLTIPEICFLRGSTFGGSMIKVGWIGVSMHLQVNLASGGILTTSPIKFVKVYSNQKAKDEMIRAAESIASEPADPEEIKKAINKLLEEKIPNKNLSVAKEMVGRFSLGGQIAISSLIVYAQEADKFKEAMHLLARFYKEHWSYQHPEVRGDPDFTIVNAQYLQKAYEELGIEPS